LNTEWLDLARAAREFLKAGQGRSTWNEVLVWLEDRPGPEAAYLVKVLVPCLKGKGAKRTFRRTAPDRRKPGQLPAYLFHRALQWHRGVSGGSLWGAMTDMALDPEESERADTAAQILLAMMGSTSKAVAAWERAIYGT
jgi:hypothetical protein